MNTKTDKSEAVPQEAPMTAREEWAEFLKTAMIAVVLALIIRTLFFEPFNIPSSSMKPTLLVGDYLFVNKMEYGYSRYSFPFGFAPIEGRIFDKHGEKRPERGDVIVFRLPTNPSIDYIKRIVGLPGDTIQVINGRLYINGEIVPREFVAMREVDEFGTKQTMMEYIETLPGGIIHRIYEESDKGPLDNTELYTVPDNHYFAMGDNRDNSQDSRVGNMVGYIPFENILGPASILFFSSNGSANIAEIWKWPWAIRYERLFDKIGPIRPPTAVPDQT